MADVSGGQNRPYLTRLQSLQHAYPTLGRLLDKLLNFNDLGRREVETMYEQSNLGSPGRCCVIEFRDGLVTHQEFQTVDALRGYFDSVPLLQSTGRLYVLEDLEPDFVDALGEELGVDPLVFAEQMNTWHNTDVKSVRHRELPSLTQPENAFTLRYFEFRSLGLESKNHLSKLRDQMTFALNRRYYEPWVTVKSHSMPDGDHSVAFVRRCASFWTDRTSEAGWNAIMLVDPPINAVRVPNVTPGRQPQETPRDFYIFKGRKYDDLNARWHRRDPGRHFELNKTLHFSQPYHKGYPTIYPLSFRRPDCLGITERIAQTGSRNIDSPFDETVFYWTVLADQDRIREAQHSPVNTAYHLLKFIAYHWTNTIEVISYTLAQTEYFSDDNPATRPKNMNAPVWRREFNKVVESARKISHFQRQVHNFKNSLNLNLERLGASPDGYAVGGSQLPKALSDAHKDFKLLFAYFEDFCSRLTSLSSVVSDTASLRAAYKAMDDSASGLILNVLATIIFPFTLVASILSMTDDFMPGKPKFWVFFAASMPLSAVIYIFLLLAQKWNMSGDFVTRKLLSTRKKSKERLD